MKLQGKIAFVTGAASGIGAATARLFAAEGATVIGADLFADKVKDGLKGVDGAHGIALDVSDSAAVNAAFAAVEREHGRLDVLVNAAGINAPTKKANDRLVEINVEAFEAAGRGEAYHPDFLSETTDEDFAKVLSVNLVGPFYCLRAAAPLMRRSGGGSIVNIASVAALVGAPMPLYYPASKAGVLGLTRAAAGELAPHNIRVNAVAPGAVDTPLLNAQPPEIVAGIVSMQPIKRPATPDELARTLLFLASDDGAYYTGQTISPSGGLYM
ncbi:SDR family NAD(P)-dependent oxidoreductase [Streptomyces sp. NPDC055955]|uniref:SDR family NAD(P)-dependent oxidoreductase n=1 Tax=Streptomyces sp. NPDC055955 TaxID=3345665 RepID=UPI0035D987F7